MKERISGRFSVKRLSGLNFECEKGKSRTCQQFKDECDLNSIIYKYKVHGVTPFQREPLYGDVSNVPDLHNMQNIIINAHNKFMELPSSLRARFDNDPQLLLEFISNKDNESEAIELGLINAPLPQPVVNVVEPDNSTEPTE